MSKKKKCPKFPWNTINKKMTQEHSTDRVTEHIRMPEQPKLYNGRNWDIRGNSSWDSVKNNAEKKAFCPSLIKSKSSLETVLFPPRDARKLQLCHLQAKGATDAGMELSIRKYTWGERVCSLHWQTRPPVDRAATKESPPDPQAILTESKDSDC